MIKRPLPLPRPAPNVGWWAGSLFPLVGEQPETPAAWYGRCSPAPRPLTNCSYAVLHRHIPPHHRKLPTLNVLRLPSVLLALVGMVVAVSLVLPCFSSLVIPVSLLPTPLIIVLQRPAFLTSVSALVVRCPLVLAGPLVPVACIVLFSLLKSMFAVCLALLLLLTHLVTLLLLQLGLLPLQLGALLGSLLVRGVKTALPLVVRGRRFDPLRVASTSLFPHWSLFTSAQFEILPCGSGVLLASLGDAWSLAQ